MNKITGIIVGIVVVAIAGASYAVINKGRVVDTAIDQSSGMENKKEVMVKNDPLVQSGDAGMVTEGKEVITKVGSYEVYAPEKLARAETGDVVLFFHASWCPSCRGLNADIEKNIGAIPSGVSILKVDYDTQTELKKKYGITYQHTLVQVAADGTLIKRWSGSPTLSSVVSQIN